MREITEEQLNKAMQTQLNAFVGVLHGELVPIKDDLEVLRQSDEGQRVTLDAISRNTEHWKTEAAALKTKLDRHETWIQLLARKAGLHLSHD